MHKHADIYCIANRHHYLLCHDDCYKNKHINRDNDSDNNRNRYLYTCDISHANLYRNYCYTDMHDHKNKYGHYDPVMHLNGHSNKY